MDESLLIEAQKYVEDNIEEFHQKRIDSLKKMNLKHLLKKKNPYLFKAKNIIVASDLVEQMMDAFISSSEEKFFGDFFENFAIFIASKTANGTKSSASGIDLEFNRDNVHYLVSIKSGSCWGNSSSTKKLEDNFKKAIKVLKQSSHEYHVEPILGICYGSTKTNQQRNWTKYVGQSFWEFISGNQDLYKDIIEPIGYKAKEKNEAFMEEKGRLVNKLTKELIEDFCDDSGNLNWLKIVEYNSGNLT